MELKLPVFNQILPIQYNNTHNKSTKILCSNSKESNKKNIHNNFLPTIASQHKQVESRG